MAMIFTIDLIEGNSHIGVPVFSNSAKKENKNYMVFSQPRAPKKIEESDNEEGDSEELKQQKKKMQGNGAKDFKSVDRVSSNYCSCIISFKYFKGSRTWRRNRIRYWRHRGHPGGTSLWRILLQ
jgi:hypothetical protein